MKARLQKEFIEQEVSTTSIISDLPFNLCISQCIIHHQQICRVARSRITHLKFKYCAGAIDGCGWREEER